MNILNSMAVRIRSLKATGSAKVRAADDARSDAHEPSARARRQLAAFALLTSACLVPLAASAKCSRVIVVPASSLGKMVVVDEATGSVSGIYPEVLRIKGRTLGCTFEFPVVSRARAELMYQHGEADLLVAASQVADRQQWGSYSPMVRVEWLLISNTAGPVPRTVEELVAMPGVRFNAVRGYGYGAGYRELLQRLEGQGKLELVSNPEIIAKKMLAGRADFTFMPSNTFAGALESLNVERSRRNGFHYSRLTDVPASTSGVYLSRGLDTDDRKILNRMLDEIRSEGLVLKEAAARCPKRDLVSLSPLKRPAAGSLTVVASR